MLARSIRVSAFGFAALAFRERAGMPSTDAQSLHAFVKYGSVAIAAHLVAGFGQRGNKIVSRPLTSRFDH